MPYEIPHSQRKVLAQMEPEDFWQNIAEMKNYKEEFVFPNLVKLARVTLALPHANADAEMVFSHVTDVKSKKRNRMGNELLDSICVTRMAMRQRDEACYQYKITPDHLSKHNQKMYD
ncbi:Putative AC transposase [Frankliniella fusca]|uniref:AC transposase n=1 Tax=Frankliniella fusca TaxID=407009 RepID=A0AAE1HMA7_9NEOP|nr:Putative AC transposase [Frankliniella fusca]